MVCMFRDLVCACLFVRVVRVWCVCGCGVGVRVCVRARLRVSACVPVRACAMYVVLCAAAGVRPLGLAQVWLSILAGWLLVYDRWD